MLKSNPYMKSYLNIIKESTSIEKYQRMAKIVGGEYIFETNTIDCNGNKVGFNNWWLNDEGSFDFKLINTSNDWSFMFSDCNELIYLPDDFTISNTVTDCSYMFDNCYKLTHLPNNFTIPNGVTNCFRMFCGCKSLTFFPKDFNLPNTIENCSYMFEYCKSLRQLPDNFTIPNNIKDCYGMFLDCQSLTHLPKDFHIPFEANCDYIFNNCYNLSQKDPEKYKMWEI